MTLPGEGKGKGLHLWHPIVVGLLVFVSPQQQPSLHTFVLQVIPCH